MAAAHQFAVGEADQILDLIFSDYSYPPLHFIKNFAHCNIQYYAIIYGVRHFIVF